jgi:hypothetical protein
MREQPVPDDTPREARERRERLAERRRQEAAEALIAAHDEATELLDLVQAKIDGFDPDTADWGNVGDLNYIVSMLKNALGRE